MLIWNLNQNNFQEKYEKLLQKLHSKAHSITFSTEQFFEKKKFLKIFISTFYCEQKRKTKYVRFKVLSKLVASLR